MLPQLLSLNVRELVKTSWIVSAKRAKILVEILRPQLPFSIGHGCAAIQQLLKTCTLRLVLCAVCQQQAQQRLACCMKSASLRWKQVPQSLFVSAIGDEGSRPGSMARMDKTLRQSVGPEFELSHWSFFPCCPILLSCGVTTIHELPQLLLCTTLSFRMQMLEML